MKKTLLFLILAALWLISTCPVMAETDRSADLTDSRLSQKITLQASGITLSDLMKLMTKGTGVSFTVDDAKDQWPVRERKIQVDLKSVTLSNVMAGIKNLYQYSWRQQDTKNGVEYILYQSAVDKEDERKQLAAQLDAIAKAKVSNLRRILEQYKKALDLSPEAAEANKQKDPFAYALSIHPTLKGACGIFASLSLDDCERILSGETRSFTYRQSSPQIKEWLQMLVKGYQSSDLSANSVPPPSIEADRLTLTISAKPPVLVNYHIRASEFMVRLVSVKGNQIWEISSSMPEINGWSFQGDELVFPSQDQSHEAPGFVYTDEVTDDPLLLTKVDVSGTGSVIDRFKKVAREFNLSTMSDVYPNLYSKYYVDAESSLVNDQSSFVHLLNVTSVYQRKIWRKEGSVILWEDPDWVIKRQWDLPKETINALKQQYSAGSIDLDQMVQLSLLSQGQLVYGIGAEPGLKELSYLVQTHLEALHFIASLDQQQRQALQSKKGLATTSLTLLQQKLALKMIAEFSTLNAYDTLPEGASLAMTPNESGMKLDFVDINGERYFYLIPLPKRPVN